MSGKSVLISGAGVAGPALAYWLTRSGYRVTVVERAAALRLGGYAVDFRGTAIDVLSRMGFLDAVKARQTAMGAVAYVDRENRRLAEMPAFFLSGELEILRGDLCAILFEATKERAEYRFGDSIETLTEAEDGIDVTFTQAAPQRFDLVIGADGVHSQVRGLVFGEEDQFLHHLGHYVAVFSIPNYLGLDHTGRYFNTPGKLAAIYSARDNTEAKASFYFASPPIAYDYRNSEAQKAIVSALFAGEGWEVPRLLREMVTTPDFYFDSISQIQMPRWSSGRVTLLGDAAHCASPLSGMGTGMAIVGAYILAGELRAAGDDYATAFASYEAQMREYADRSQQFAHGGSTWFVPKSRLMMGLRNTNLRILPYLPWKGLIAKMAQGPANSVALKDYAA